MKITREQFEHLIDTARAAGTNLEQHAAADVNRVLDWLREEVHKVENAADTALGKVGEQAPSPAVGAEPSTGATPAPVAAPTTPEESPHPGVALQANDAAQQDPAGGAADTGTAEATAV